MPTDHELVRQALSGGTDAAEALLLRHDGALRRYAAAQFWQSLEGDVDDVMQEFYLKICRNGFRALALWRGLTDPGHESIEGYFKAILRNILMDLARRSRHRDRQDGEDALDDIPDPAASDEDAIAAEQLRAAMSYCVETALNDGQRLVVRLFLEGRDHAEIAGLLGIEAGNSRVRLHRALAALRTCIESAGRNDRYARGVLE